RPLQKVAGRRQRLAGRMTQLQPLLAEQDQNAARWCGERGKSELGGIGHGSSSQGLAGIRGSLWLAAGFLLSPPAGGNFSGCSGGESGGKRACWTCAALTICCACSTALPWRSHYVD